MEKKWLTLIGIALIIWEIIDMAYNLPYTPWYNAFWFSRNVFFLVGIALIWRNKIFSGGVALAVVGAEIFWAIDFFMMLAGYTFMNTTKYVLDFNWIGILFQLGHVVIIPFAIFLAYQVGMHKKSWIVTGGIATLFLSLGRLAPSSANINCAYGYCGMGIASHSYLYFILFLGLLWVYAYIGNAYLCRFTKLCR